MQLSGRFSMFRFFILGMIPLLLMGLTACEPLSPDAASASTASDPASFKSCVDTEAKKVLASAIASGTDPVLVGYHTDINNRVIAACDPQLSPESESDSEYSADPNYSYVNATVETRIDTAMKAESEREAEADEKQDALNAAKEQAEDSEVQEAGDAYYACLVSNVKSLAQESNEVAPIIVQAAFPACSSQRSIAFSVMQQQRPYLGSCFMTDIDADLAPHLLLEVIKDRARPPQ